MKNEKGQSLFEVVVALAVSAAIVIALVSLVTNSIKNAVFSKNETQAATLAQQTIEWLRGERDENINEFLSNTQANSYCLVGLNWNTIGACANGSYVTGTQFTRQVDFTFLDVSGKTVINTEVTVSWDDPQGTHSVNATTSFTDWRQR